MIGNDVLGGLLESVGGIGVTERKKKFISYCGGAISWCA